LTPRRILFSVEAKEIEKALHDEAKKKQTKKKKKTEQQKKPGVVVSTNRDTNQPKTNAKKHTHKTNEPC
jgi:hypothetical protein